MHEDIISHSVENKIRENTSRLKNIGLALIVVGLNTACNLVYDDRTPPTLVAPNQYRRVTESGIYYTDTGEYKVRFEANLPYDQKSHICPENIAYGGQIYRFKKTAKVRLKVFLLDIIDLNQLK